MPDPGDHVPLHEGPTRLSAPHRELHAACPPPYPSTHTWLRYSNASR
jgi:hypothetical protein